MEFTAELAEQRVEEHKAAYFTCTVSKDDITVTWLKNGKNITPDEKHVILDDGCVHTLIINNTDMSDVAEYTVVIGDKTSSAKLHLDGESIVYTSVS